MLTPLLTGCLLSFSIAALFSAVFFLRAWSERREDREYLYFGLFVLCMAAHGAVVTVGYARALGIELWSLEVTKVLLVVPSKPGLAFLLHYALRYARVKHLGRIMAPVYILSAAFVLLGVQGGWWSADHAHFEELAIGGLTVHRVVLHPSAAALPFYVAVAIVALVVLFLLGRTWRRGRREGLAAFVGASLLLPVALNEIAITTGLFPTVPISPFGLVALAYGVSLTLVIRYGRLSRELGDKTNQLQQRSLELKASYDQLKRAQEQLVRSEQRAMVGELAAVIAHEVRNPLAIVNNAVASLRKQGTRSEDRKTLLEIIDEEMTRLDKLVGRLLNYARPVLPRREVIDLRDLLERSCGLADDKPDVQRTIRFGEGVPTVLGDPDLLRQAFENVVTNAVQAIGERGHLEVTVDRWEVHGVKAVRVAFRDDGEGMSREQSSHALSPFFTTRPTGTGLGLPIVGRIVEAHGGLVRIDSQPGGGTTVGILLPQETGAALRATEPSGRRISLLP